MKDLTQEDLEKNIPLASKKSEDHRTIVDVNGVKIGGEKIVVMAGPCVVESLEQILDIARNVKILGADILRGGAFKPLTFPYRNDRLKESREEGVKYLREASEKYKIPSVSEVMDPRLVKFMAENIDILQIGARNMYNYPLLEEVGKTKKPVLLKRNQGAGLREWLGAVEYILEKGNPNVILCERGIVAAHTNNPNARFIPDIGIIPITKDYTHLPIIFDPSHSMYERKYIPAMAKAAIAAGADGLMIEVHPNPEKAWVDRLSSLNYEEFMKFMGELLPLVHSVKRSMLK